MAIEAKPKLKKIAALDVRWGEPGLYMSCYFQLTPQDIRRLARYIDQYAQPDRIEVIYDEGEEFYG